MNDKDLLAIGEVRFWVNSEFEDNYLNINQPFYLNVTLENHILERNNANSIDTTKLKIG